jgi:hypothetical protein
MKNFDNKLIFQLYNRTPARWVFMEDQETVSPFSEVGCGATLSPRQKSRRATFK